MTTERIHYLDWLKVLIVYGIVLFHVCLVFSYGSWLVNDSQRSVVLSAFDGFCFPWGIPAMFLIAGADSWFGLRSHTVRDFVWKRFLRLLVPMVPGLLVLSPLQRFFASHNPPPSLDRLPAFYVEFFRGMHFEWSLQVISRYWLHLWFLGYLFAVSIVCVPALVWLRTPQGLRLTTSLVAIARRRSGLLVLGLPLAVSQLILRPGFSDYENWADVATYTVVFLWGAVLFSNRGFEAAIRSQVRLMIACGLLATVGLGLFLYAAPLSPWGGTPVGEIGRALSWSLFIWSWLHAVIYLGIRWLDFPSPIEAYARESVLAVYVIHHPFVVLTASLVVPLGIGMWPKFFLILLVVAIATLTTYEFGVRRWSVMRLVFGMEARPKVRRRGGVPAEPAGPPAERRSAHVA